jgi:periplasmic protein CpxP/Spy
MTSKQTRWATIVVAVLAILNIALIATIWLQNKKQIEPQRPPDARELLVHDLDLNEEQVKVFDSLRKIHFNEVGLLREQMHEKKDELFSRLSSAGESPDSAAASIGNLQTKIELATFRHFAALRTILNKDQQVKFDQVIQEVLRNMGRPDGPGDKERKGRPRGGEGKFPPPGE